MPRRNKKRDAGMALKGYIPAAQAAQMTGYNESTIYRWLDEKTIEGVLVANSRYVKVDSLAKHLGPEAAKVFGLAGSSSKPV